MKNTNALFSAAFIDLDDTLFDTSGILIPSALQDTFDALIANGLDCKKEDLEDFHRQNPRLAGELLFDQILLKWKARRSKVAKSKTEMRALAHDVYYNRTIPSKLSPFPGVKDWLEENSEAGLKLFLVSAGEKYTQARKIEALGFTNLFDDIFVTEVKGRQAKRDVFSSVLRKHKFLPATTFVLGNRLDDEIQAGFEQGQTTCWMNRGEQGDATDAGKWAHYVVTSFGEFRKQWPTMQQRSS